MGDRGEMIDLEKAFEFAGEVERDLQNGVRTGLAERTIQKLTAAILDALEDAVDLAAEQAEWELKNNPMKPDARIACEKIERGLQVIRGKYAAMIRRALDKTS